VNAVKCTMARPRRWQLQRCYPAGENKEMDRLLEVKNLKTYFYQDTKVIPAVDDVSFFIDRNSVLGMVGESGCGKTMTALSITRLLPKAGCRIVSGKIHFSGSNLAAISDEQLREKRGREVSYIFQEPSTSLNPVLTVREQLEEVIRLHRKDIAPEMMTEFIVGQLEEVGIHFVREKMRGYPHQLSGGEKQRVMIAMAMVCRPKLLIADEPTTALDVTIQAQILSLLQNLKDSFGVSIFLISHDFNVIGELADYIAVMYAGQIVEFSHAQDLIRNPKHPYTCGLIDCLPSIRTTGGVFEGGKDKKLNVIRGEVPKADSFPQGCRFHPRCPKVFERCRIHMPPMFRAENKEEVRCWLYSGFQT